MNCSTPTDKPLPRLSSPYRAPITSETSRNGDFQMRLMYVILVRATLVGLVV